MNKISEFLTDGSVTLKKIKSPINGILTVKWDMLSGYTILGGGLWQVGGPVETVWRAGIKAVKARNVEVKNALILGLGGGTTATLIRHNWPKAFIVGVDIDPIIVKLGEDYLNLKKLNIETHIDDAYKFVTKTSQKNDIICVDTYVGDNYPEKLASNKFLSLISKNLTQNGMAIFNRIFDNNQRKQFENFEEKLNENFATVRTLSPSRELVNTLFVCSN